MDLFSNIDGGTGRISGLDVNDDTPVFQGVPAFCVSAGAGSLSGSQSFDGPISAGAATFRKHQYNLH